MKKDFKIIGFDADDTLWVNEPYFQDTEKQFCDLLSSYHSAETISKELYKTEMQNLELYGYGAKGFMLSMIETAMRISNGKISNQGIKQIIGLGKAMLNQPIELLDGIEEVLNCLSRANYKLIVATKGDLLDQERKLAKSGLGKYFHHIEIMSDKKEANYEKLLSHLNVAPENFLMVGNSMKSDIIPVVSIGSYGIYVPFHTTWAHEKTERPNELGNSIEVGNINELLDILDL